MAWTNLKAAIAAVVRTNNNQEITGANLQGVLNAIVNSIGANATYAGIATPSTNPGTPDGPVFYFALQGGTYTNFGAAIIQEGLTVLFWDSTTWTATSAFDKENMREVYDISAANGNETYDNLNDALTSNTGGVPLAVRKSGMSVKFINSTTSKYEQWRYMLSSTTNANFANVANWQGVDDEPTAGSVNLAESGGINKFVAEVNSIGKKELNFDFYGYTIKYKYSIDSEGYIVQKAYNNYRTIYTNTPVNKGAVLHFTGTCNTDGKLFVIAISDVPITDENLTSVHLTILSYKYYPIGDMSEKIIVPFDGYIVYYRYDQYWTNVSPRVSNVSVLQDNSVLNVSELNNASYISLSEALADVPATLQKGGISIRFMNSKTNSYETWSLISNIWSINIEDWTCVYTYKNESSSDLDIMDGMGNILARFSEGHVQTKNFDSSKIKIAIQDTESGDFNIIDDNENILSNFSEGHFRTKKFDSRKAVYHDAPVNNCEFFKIFVNTNISNTEDATLQLQDGVNYQIDNAAIYLPPTYKSQGTPTRLIIFGFSTSSNIGSSTPTNIHHGFPETSIALGEGYACLVVNGTPGTNNPGGVGNNGTPLVIRSIVQAYKYVTEKYNIAKDGVFTAGYSQGSLVSLQVHLSGLIPVIASAMFGPDVELWKVEYTGKDSTVRENMLTKFGMVEKEASDGVKQLFPDLYGQGGIVVKPTSFSATGAVPTDIEKAYILNNIDKWVGYNPMTRFIKSSDILSLYSIWYAKGTDLHIDEGELYENISICLPHPLKLFVGTLDAWGITRFTRWFFDAAIRGGSIIEKREYTGQQHAFYGYDDLVTFKTKYSGEIQVHASSVECILFFNRYNF